MADINVERRGPRVWPWIIGILLLILLIWIIAEVMNSNGTVTTESVEVVPAPVGPGEPVHPPPGAVPGPDAAAAPDAGTTPGATPAPGTETAPGATPPPAASPPGDAGTAPPNSPS